VGEQRLVLLDVRDGVARITFNRPDSGNALDAAMALEFTEALQAVRADEAARAVLLTGNGRLFCAGGDLRAMHAAADRGAFLRELADAAHRAIRELAATFVTAYTSVGLTPDCGQSWLLPRAVGLGRALDLTLVPSRVPQRRRSRWASPPA
jgi:2-(1,2-epoxy-1,2-dihydrophenyl)acetyl-CoA isomerase